MTSFPRQKKSGSDSIKTQKVIPPLAISRSFLLSVFRLRACDFYEVRVDEDEARINYHLIKIESEKTNCFSRVRDPTLYIQQENQF